MIPDNIFSIYSSLFKYQINSNFSRLTIVSVIPIFFKWVSTSCFGALSTPFRSPILRLKIKLSITLATQQSRCATKSVRQLNPLHPQNYYFIVFAETSWAVVTFRGETRLNSTLHVQLLYLDMTFFNFLGFLTVQLYFLTYISIWHAESKYVGIFYGIKKFQIRRSLGFCLWTAEMQAFPAITNDDCFCKNNSVTGCKVRSRLI